LKDPTTLKDFASQNPTTLKDIESQKISLGPKSLINGQNGN
jgi:hypothetical protein